jgi:hypothetical protein
MSIVLVGNNEPSKIKLINIPVTIDNVSYNALFYLNNYTLDRSSYFKDDYFTVGRYLESSFNSNLRNPTCIVIPIPVPHNYNYELGFIDLSIDKTVNFLNNLNKFKKDTQNDTKLDMLDVYNIGIYKISIASSKYDLVNKIDWNIFIKPNDFEKRLSTLDNTNLFYSEYKWLYMVLSTDIDIKSDGFGILYKSSDVDYFPICREEKDRFNMNNNVNYNAEIYHFSKNNGSVSKIGPLKTSSSTTILTDSDLNILNYLSTIPVQFEKGKVKQMQLDNIKYCNYYKIFGSGTNKNLYLMK